ncbi:hypothetical protein ACN47E_002425 [Coniothyrium glycines]
MSTDSEGGEIKPVKTRTGHLPASVVDRALPHSTSFPDPYALIGDCYTRSSNAQDWEIPDSQPYLTHVKSLSTSWKTLRHLADWMQVGTTPLRWHDIRQHPTERKTRASKTNITFIEYRPELAPTTTAITTPIALKEVLHAIDNDPASRSPLRLFVVEDLSRDVIELLGSRFDIDPLFFREQIDDYVWHNTRDPWAMPPNLMSNMKHRQWFRLRNIRFRYHDSADDLKAAQKETNSWNVLRRPDDDFNHWHYADKPGAVVSMLRTRTTIWIGKDQKSNNGTVGIILLDPTESHGKPLWYDRTNWLPVPKMSMQTPNIQSSVSWYADIVQMTKLFPWVEMAEGHVIDAQVLAKPTLYTICAEWLVACDYVKARLGQIERELELPDVFRSKGDAIDSSLKRLHVWRRSIPVFREMVLETVNFALPAAARLTTPPAKLNAGQGPNSPLTVRTSTSEFLEINFDNYEGFEDIVPDFRRVLALLVELQERVDRLSGVVASEISIEDSRRGLEENHNMARLTWLATIFIPMTFVSGLYSMNGSVSELKQTYWIYFVTAMPFTLVVMAVGWVAGGGSLTPWKKTSTKQRGGIGSNESKKTR